MEGPREGEVHEQHDVPRAQKRPLPGTRPEPLPEVAEPQVGAVTVGYVAAPGPLLSTPSLADTMADPVDDRAVQFLLQMALKKKKREEEKEERRRQEEVAEHDRRMRVLDRRVWDDEELTPEESLAWRAWAGHLPRRTRKRKKRRKRKLPKSSSCCRRPCALQRHVPAVQRVDSVFASVHRRLLDILVVQQRQVSGSILKTVVVPQLQFIACRRLPLRAAEADPHDPDCSAVHCVSPVAVRCHVVDVPIGDLEV